MRHRGHPKGALLALPSKWPPAAFALVVTCLIALFAQTSGAEAAKHGLALYGEPALPHSFDHLPYANPSAPKGGKLRLGMAGGYESLNPFNFKFAAAPQLLIGNVYQSLMARSQDEPYSMYALIAQSVELGPEREYVIFRLDPRARFSDRRPITAEDVLFSFELLKAKGRPGQRDAFSRVTRSEAADTHTVRFDLGKGADRELPLLLAAMPILSKTAVDSAHFDDVRMDIPVGSGPYLVKEAKAGERLVLARDSDYWAKDIPSQRGLYNFDEIDVSWYRDGGALFEALKGGLIDYREESSAARWLTAYDFPAKRDGRIVKDTLRPGRPVGMSGFVFNLRNKLFEDVALREAMAMMFDFEWVNANFYGGLYKRTTSYFEGSPFSSFGRPASEGERALLARFPDTVRQDALDGSWRPTIHDGSGRDREIARRAIRLVSQSGYKLTDKGLEKDGRPVAFEIMIRDRDEERLALNFSASLKRIGINAQPRLYDETQYQQRRRKFEYDMMIGQWLPSAVPGAEQAGRWSSASLDNQKGTNLAGASSLALDALIEALIGSKTPEEHVDAARALDRALLSGFYFVPLFFVDEIWTAHSATLERPSYLPHYPMYPFGFTLEQWWWKSEEIRND
ncbi:extracellular solute-binding protein [Methylocystis sp. ATCC 49242]|uniref:extracellular solute-binding protein n=1 Tax=Methylocystis sp. ATCC 49242 TaxID=622637 RepID=UPI0001F884C1|nr:extracellular solute-binding protein [Methylocystis sp. ATCC 49242]